MVVYRVSRLKYARDLSGEGARLWGGRWNPIEVPCIYTSESRALAILEYSVNINLDDIPRALCIISIQIPDENIRTFSLAELPGNWRAYPAPVSTQEFGSRLLQGPEAAVLRVPSAVVPEEYNYLLNPSAGHLFSLLDIRDLAYDLRIKTM